jgi:hypothetical protein
MMSEEPSFNDLGGDDEESDGFSPVAVVCTMSEQCLQSVSSPVALWDYISQNTSPKHSNTDASL